MSKSLTSENVREELRKIEALAATAWAKADKMRADMIAEGVNPLTDADALAKIDAAYKEYSTLASEAREAEAALARLTAYDTMAKPNAASHAPERAANRGGSGSPRSIGYRVTEAAQVAEFQASLRKSLDSHGDAIAYQFATQGFAEPAQLMSRDEMAQFHNYLATTVTGGGATSAGPFIVNDLQAGYVPYARKQPTLASMVGNGSTDSDVVEYVTQTAVSTGAVETAEDSAAPESTISFATNTTNVREITHFVPVTLRAMADAGQLRTIVEQDLLAGVIDRLDTQIFAGGGTGQDLTGITITSGINTQPLGGDTRLDCLHKAITQIRVAVGVLSEPDYIGMHGNDWQKIRLEKDSDGAYLMGPPGMSGERQVWGVPVVVSNVFTAGAPLVGDFGRSARLWIREGVSVNAGLDGNDFTKRRISLLAAMRIAFAVTRPAGFSAVSGF